MDQTSRGYPYPECAPPLIKDASFIGQMADLASAIDADMTTLAERANAELIQPDAIRRIMPVSIPTTTNVQDPFFSSTTFTNNPAMEGLVGVVAPETGWYMAGTHTVVTSGVAGLGARSRFLVNAQPVTQYSDVGGIYAGGGAQFVHSSSTFLLNAGDELHIRLTHGSAAASSWTYQSRLWMIRLLGL